MTGDPAFTVDFELGLIAVWCDGSGRVTRIAFQGDGTYGRKTSRGPAARAIRRYLEGHREPLRFPVVFHGAGEFTTKVWNRAMEIPYGTTVTYGELAASVGCPGGARAVGRSMAANRLPLVIPCHRVVAAGGRLGGFGPGVEVKRWLLDLEGAVL